MFFLFSLSPSGTAQFIRKEAEEKANEIRAAAQEEYTIQKQTVVEAEKAKIRKEYERKRSQIDTKKAIEQLMTVAKSEALPG